MSTAEFIIGLSEDDAAERKKEARKILWALLVALGIHLLIGYGLAVFGGLLYRPFSVSEEEKPVELTFVDLPPAVVPTPTPDELLLTEVNRSKESATAPKEKTFQANINSVAASFLQGHGAEVFGISFRHVEKARAKTLVVGADQRIAALQVDVIFQHYQAALLELQIDSARSIGEQHCLDSQARKHAHRKRHPHQRMSFVIMDASLHGRDWNFTHFSNYEISGVSFSAGSGKIRNL